MQSGRSRRKLYPRTGKYYGRAPAGYSRARAQRRGRAAAIRRRRFIPGYDRTGGYYRRYTGPNAEMKFKDFQLDDAVIASGGTVTATIHTIAEGNGEQERVGRKVTIKKVGWRYKIELPESDAQATPAEGDTVRAIMFLDKQCNGATATVTDILETANWQSFNNLANKSRFRILMDRTHDLNYSGIASDGAGVVSQANVVENYSFYKTCNIPIEYDNSATTGVITSIRSNNIGVLMISKSGLASMISKIRTRYSDH